MPGPIVRNAPNALNFNSDAAYVSIYGVRKNVRKVDSYGAASASRHRPNTLTAIQKDDVNWFRRQHLHFLSETGVKCLEDRILERVQTLTDLLGVVDSKDTQSGPCDEKCDGWSSSKNMDIMSKWLAFDVITDLCFGETANLLGSAENRSYIKGIASGGRVGLMVRTTKRISRGSRWLTLGNTAWQSLPYGAGTWGSTCCLLRCLRHATWLNGQPTLPGR